MPTLCERSTVQIEDAVWSRCCKYSKLLVYRLRCSRGRIPLDKESGYRLRLVKQEKSIYKYIYIHIQSCV